MMQWVSVVLAPAPTHQPKKVEKTKTHKKILKIKNTKINTLERKMCRMCQYFQSIVLVVMTRFQAWYTI